MNHKKSINLQDVFGRNVKCRRESLGITREKLAELAEYSAQNIAKIENGDRFITAEALMRLADALKVKPSYLLETENESLNKKQTSTGTAIKEIQHLLSDRDGRFIEMVKDIVARLILG